MGNALVLGLGKIRIFVGHTCILRPSLTEHLTLYAVLNQGTLQAQSTYVFYTKPNLVSHYTRIIHFRALFGAHPPESRSLAVRQGASLNTLISLRFLDYSIFVNMTTVSLS